jgi:hypothetical protein
MPGCVDGEARIDSVHGYVADRITTSDGCRQDSTWSDGKTCRPAPITTLPWLSKYRNPQIGDGARAHNDSDPEA